MKSRILDLTGQIFGRLKAIRYSHTNKNRQANWFCRCECGRETIVNSNSLRRKLTQSCGCYAKEKQGQASFQNLIGQKFNRLTVIGIDKSKKIIHWICKCECNNKSIVRVRTSSLKNGHTKSCGCYHKHRVMSKLDLSNQKIGKILVLSKSHKIGHTIYWDCICDCGTKFITTTGNLRRTSEPVRSCGCLRIENRPRGPKNHNWNPNLTKEERENKRNLEEYPIWRKQVFERDNYTCQLSGVKGRINAHHIESWATNKNLRFELDNGITLSERLHKLFHKIYGKTGNSKEQFEEFKERYKNGEFDIC